MQVNNILSLFRKNKQVGEIIEKSKIDKYNLYCNGMTFNHTILLASSVYRANNEFIMLVYNNAFLANKAYDSLCDVLGYEYINLYAVDDFVANEAIAISGELKQERLSTIKSIIENKPKIIVTHIQALLKPLISLNNFKNSIIKIEKDKELDINELVTKLTNMGYKRTSVTYSIGEFSIRGEVIDIYPSCSDNPIRINLAFDEVEQIKYYNIENQMTVGDKINEFNIYPINEIIIDFDTEELRKNLLKLDNSEYVVEDLADIFELGAYDKLVKYIDYFDKDNSTLLNYLDNPIVFLNEIKDTIGFSK